MSNKDKHDFVRACAFWGILVSAILFVVSAVLRFVDVKEDIFAIVDLLAKLALLAAVAIPAYDWVKYKKTGWRVIYWIALVIYVFGVVFGVLKIYMK